MNFSVKNCQGIFSRTYVMTPCVMFIFGYFVMTSTRSSTSFHSLQENKNFVKPDELYFPKDENQYIHLGVILKGLNSETGSANKMKYSLSHMFESLVLFTKRMPVRLIFITDLSSKSIIEEIWNKSQPPFPLFNTIRFGSEETQVPRFQRIYIDVSNIEDQIDPWSKGLKTYFNHAGSKHTIKSEKLRKFFVISYPKKYDATIFYLMPFHHKIFSSLNKLVMIDVDVRFKSDPYELYSQFDNFSTENLLGVANDLAPHYREMLTLSGYLDAHPETQLGKPGKFQGLNVGIVLFRLDRMRTNKVYDYFLSSDGTRDLAQKYGFTKTHLGAQDWLTLVLFEKESLIYNLNCKFNYQLGEDYNIEPWKEIFPSYHNCNETPSILHGNGDSLLNVQ